MDNSESEVDTEKKKLEKIGCEHYSRRCELLSPCCNKYFTCRFCHDEKTQSLPYPGEKVECHVLYLDRRAVKTIRCMICKTDQGPTQVCVNCKTKFSNYFCEICRLYDDSENIYHCDECGICRVGLRETTVHCAECKSCFYKDTQKEHKCYPNALDDNCPICLQHFGYARESFTQLNCLHWIHISCLKTYVLEKKGFNCPVCIKPIFAETEQMKKQYDALVEASIESLPPELKGKTVKVFCNSCQKTSLDSKFNLIALKCTHCGSYNTKR